MQNSGIYKIRNLVDGKVYVGSAIYLNVRRTSHFSELKSNTHKNNHLQRSYNKYGKENFIFEIIEIAEDVETLMNREDYWIGFYRESLGRENVYNIREHASSNLGVKFSDESKARMSKIKKGRIVSEEGRRNLSNAIKGINNHNFGKSMSDGQKRKISESHGMDKEIILKIEDMLKNNIHISKISILMDVSRYIVYRVKNNEYKNIYGI
jgi:group I intron endonuclease